MTFFIQVPVFTCNFVEIGCWPQFNKFCGCLRCLRDHYGESIHVLLSVVNTERYHIYSHTSFKTKNTFGLRCRTAKRIELVSLQHLAFGPDDPSVRYYWVLEFQIDFLVVFVWYFEVEYDIWSSRYAKHNRGVCIIRIPWQAVLK